MKSQTRIHSYELSWLVTSDSPALDNDLKVERVPYTLPSEVIGDAWVESLALRDGIVLFRAVHSLEASPPGQLMHLMDVNIEPDEPIFCAQIWLSGLGYHREFWQGRDHSPVEIVAGPGRDTFRYHREWQGQILVEGGISSEMRSVVIPDAMLRALLGDDVTQDLLDALGLTDRRPTVVRPLPLNVGTPLREAMSGQFIGSARMLYAQARVLDYLVGLIQHVAANGSVSKEHSHGKRIRELHDYLTQLEGRLPTLSNLAKEFGLSARRLNEEFTAEFGQSVFSFMTEYRLTQAHASLQTNATPMKILADRLGYSHVNHFITAFKRKFGYPPGSLRKRK